MKGKRNAKRNRKPAAVMLAAGLCLQLLTGCTVQPAETAPADITAADTTTAAETVPAVPAAPETQTADAQTETAQAASSVPETAAAQPAGTIKAPDYRFTAENFPRMDGSTAAVPMGKAVAQFLLGCSEEQAEALCSFNRTTQSFRNLMNGKCDLLLVGEPNAAVFTEMKEEGFAYGLEDIATDALVFVVNESNPVEGLTTEQIRDIYSGKITSWKEVGGADAPIIAFQRNEGAGSQALIRKLIMKDTPMTDAPAEEIIGSMGDLMTAVKNYDNSANALGYSVYYYANDMKMARGLKILKVDGVEPNPETIRNKTYPHRNAYYCVIPEEPENGDEQAKARSTSAKVIYDWLVTQDGQDLLASIGYVSVKKPVNTWTAAGAGSLTELYTTIDGKKIGEIGELKASDSYGKLIPFIGDCLRTGDAASGDDGDSSYLYGFLDENGRIVSDAVYTEVSHLGYYDQSVIAGSDTAIPMYRVSNSVSRPEPLGNEEGEARARYRLVSADGSFVSEKDYGLVRGNENGVLCMDSYESKEMEYIGLDGKLLFTEKEVLAAVSKTLNEETVAGILWDGFEYLGGYYRLDTTNGSFLLDGTTLEALAGPFTSVKAPVDGLLQAAAYPEGVKEGDAVATVLNEKLEPVITDELTYSDVLKNGNILGENYREKWTALYTHEGELIRRFDGATYAQGAVYGFHISVPCGTTSANQIYNNDGELLFLSLQESAALTDHMVPVAALRGRKEEGTAFRCGSYDNSEGLLLYQLETGESRYLAGAGSILPLYHMDGQSEVMFMESTSSDGKDGENRITVIGRDLNTVLEGSGMVQALFDMLEGKTYYVFKKEQDGEKSSTLYDGQFNVVEENLQGEVRVHNGWIFTTDAQKTEGRRPGEAVSFRYYLASAGED